MLKARLLRQAERARRRLARRLYALARWVGDEARRIDDDWKELP